MRRASCVGFVAGDDDEAVEAVVDAVLDQQRRFVDGDGHALGAQLGEPRLGLGGDARMGDGVERAPLVGVGEDDGAEPLAVERAVRPQHLRAEGARDARRAPAGPAPRPSRATSSASTMRAPSSVRVRATVDLPLAMPPVSPITRMLAVILTNSGSECARQWS